MTEAFRPDKPQTVASCRLSQLSKPYRFCPVVGGPLNKHSYPFLYKTLKSENTHVLQRET